MLAVLFEIRSREVENLFPRFDRPLLMPAGEAKYFSRQR